MSTTVTVTQTVNDVTVDESVYDITLTAGSAFVAGLNDLTDVDTTGVANGEFLAYNSSTSTWEPTGSSATVNFLNDIGDVVITSPADGAVLTYNAASSTWIDAAASGGGASDLDDLTDVTITALGADELLFTQDGVTFINQTLAEAGISAVGHTHLLSNITDVTASVTELNYVDGVTSAIQTQLDNKQPLDTQLTDIAALTPTDSNVIVGNGTTWVAESGATARTSLGLGTGDVPTFNRLVLAASSSTGNTALDITGTQTATASGSTVFTNFTQTIAPTSNSSNTFRALTMSNTPSAGTGITIAQINGARIEGASLGATQDGLISTIVGVDAYGVLTRSTSVAAGLATEAIGIRAYGNSRPSGTSTVTGTSIAGGWFYPTGSAGLTFTNQYGIRIEPGTAGNTITNAFGADIQGQTRGSTLNIGLRVGLSAGATTNAAIQLSDTTGVVGGGLLFGADTTLHRSAANILALDGDLTVTDEAYGVGWNGSLEVPTKNALYDKIESISAGTLADGDYGDITVSGSGTVLNIDAATVGPTELSATGTPSASTFLRGDNTWATPAGSGDVSKVGTPVDGQIGVWTGDGTIEGDSALTFDTTTDSLVIAASGNLLFGAVTILDDAAGTMTLSNIDALDATTEATIEAAIDTLANLTSIQGRTVTLADAGADRLFGWDDSANAYVNLSQADARTILGLGTAAYVATDLADLNEATIEAAIDTLANLTSIQGQTISLSAPFTLPADPNADRIIFWDDSAGATAYLAPDSSLSITTTTLSRAALTGDVTASAGSNATTIANNAVTTAKILDANVTLAKMANIATDSILGRATAATGVPEVLTALPFAYTGDVTRPADSNATTLAANYKIRTLTAVIDGGGSAITTGAKKAYIQVPYSGTITEWTLLADQTGSIVIDVWKDTYANYPPTVADTITASAKPTITTAIKNTSSTLTGWTTSVTAGDIIEFNVDSVTSITKCHVFIKMTVTA